MLQDNKIKKSDAFVGYVLETIQNQKNKSFGAKLKKADNENTEYQSWEILSRWVDLENDRERKSYALIAASLAKHKSGKDGPLGLGRALAIAFDVRNGPSDDERGPGHSRLRRLLTCKDSQELILVLRSNLRLLQSRETPFSHARLLDEILSFDIDWKRDKIRASWAQEFYGSKGAEK
ncbi:MULTISPECIES: type I-E CRISPR-associated protein Cse2/CasB [unclassified Oceanispirochaeta]|uniref:type I-E CRISPR-associated protein Cse2/CasB n=1 Tax=unclassified Oceanispirochaeta TaxID=2635722 RepID=UPI001314C541|nr:MULTISPECIES: type I-E CRISPR-associated protein Cse2/CasB [unclassified Oceanispirochaeta]MBF9014136.1 type I-E CRISPR-associated protein Cse2/CasB [Oceanispirochaeta sp. M2]NPD70626.1 type I-E CRISPR-associated protein Cse2/CasB [Oceanispirochaeta sp. M1]